MTKIIKIIILILILFSFFTCSDKQNSNDTKKKIVNFNKDINFDEEFYDFFENNIDSIVFEISQKYPRKDKTGKFLKETYLKNKNLPILITKYKNKKLKFFIEQYLNKSWEHGIDSSLFLTKILQNKIDSLLIFSEQKNYYELTKFDIMLSYSLVYYSKTVEFGIVNHKVHLSKIYKSVNRKTIKYNTNFLFNDIDKHLKSLMSDNNYYLLLKSRLISLMNNKDTSKIEYPQHIEKIEVGGTSFWIPEVIQMLEKEELINLKKYKYSIQNKYFNFYDNKIDLDYYFVYDSILFYKMKEYQYQNSLIQDGVIGNNTFKKFSESKKEKIRKLKLNLERLRWFVWHDNKNGILINIPAFKLYKIKNGKVELQMKVCVGKKKEAYYDTKYKKYLLSNDINDKPKNNQTPFLNSKIHTIVINPFWNVPKSIIREMFHKLDSGYMEKRKYTVYFADTNLRQNNIDSCTPNKINFRLVQKSGYSNALGFVKFLFQNSYSVYLHDTPSKHAFSNDYRAVSHGCIRLEKPFQLANLLLRNNNKEKINKINNKIKKEEFENYYIGLTNFENLEINYFTCFPDSSDKIIFYSDVYFKDNELEKLISKFKKNSKNPILY